MANNNIRLLYCTQIKKMHIYVEKLLEKEKYRKQEKHNNYNEEPQLGKMYLLK